jgi:integrase/recombinase XerD
MQPPEGVEEATTIDAERRTAGPLLPAVVVRSGERAGKRFLEFFTAQIRNANTRRAYGRAIAGFFGWCEFRGIELHQVEPITVAAYIEQHPGSKPTVKQHLAAIRMLFDWLVTGQVVSFNPASSVRGPKYVVKKGLTPVLSAREARKLLDSIDTTTIIGLRDRALIGLMAFSFARVGAALGMVVNDYYTEARQRWFLLHEKGGNVHCVGAHPKAARYLDAYIAAAGIADNTKGPLFRTMGKDRHLTQKPMASIDALKMVKRRAAAAGLSERTCNHTFRATGITVYLTNGGKIESAQALAGHADIRTTMLYDRRADLSTLKEVKRIAIQPRIHK